MIVYSILILRIGSVFLQNLQWLNEFPKQNSHVWSLATKNLDSSTNMNIITFATQVSIKPTPLWAISLYRDTLSHENFIREKWYEFTTCNDHCRNLLTSDYYIKGINAAS